MFLRGTRNPDIVNRSRISTSLAAVDLGSVIERVCFLVPLVIGVGIIGVAGELDPGLPGLQWGLVLFSTFGYTILSVVLAVSTFYDSGRIRRRSGPWRPNPFFNAVLALLWAPVAGPIWLYRRHRRFGTDPGSSKWWIVVAISLVTTLTGLAMAAIAYLLAFPALIVTGLGLAGAIAFGTFPVAVHQDAAFVCSRSRSWQPNPGAYLGFAFLSLFVAPLQPVLATYYLLRRRRTIGLY